MYCMRKLASSVASAILDMWVMKMRKPQTNYFLSHWPVESVVDHAEVAAFEPGARELRQISELQFGLIRKVVGDGHARGGGRRGCVAHMQELASAPSRKSSTNEPSGSIAWARTPEGPHTQIATLDLGDKPSHCCHEGLLVPIARHLDTPVRQ